ncbi:putative Cutinase [Drepanopeziza brunnea f. sp. 'multigermtubi' MB_m1]|uniref:Cutinase n=1 Tax=Marssonina brunnea f. sp. multigermtubi (strain MB_m1) TaxID=1072389 RepID=K1Y229_MARBU|nr:putative Cutinase [Drepanopeziza brunnea f. sp. 'multigermtubi' MB_m1]EKD19164.1 putative Cutinase [Drepanopeziza brunnea f. sp. 'multigermtubi' MB_m1]
MKAATLLSVLPFLGRAAAMPLIQPREANSTMAPNISLLQAASMGELAALVSIAEAPTDPANENGLTGACKAVTVLYAKGTGENGNMGDGSSPGPAWVAAIRSSLGTAAVTVQGIDYDASVLGYLLGGSPSGSATYLDRINQASTQCPGTKIVLGGYSQGGQILHNAAEKLTAAVTARIAAVVIFGDPDLRDPVGTVPSSKVLEVCHVGDIICTGFGGSAAHLNYAMDAAVAAAFVVARV